MRTMAIVMVLSPASSCTDRFRGRSAEYGSRQSLVLGGKRVELVYPGRAYGADSTALFFPAERVVFVDTAPDATGAFSFGSTAPTDLLTWVRTIAQLDFDILISGEGHVTSRASLLALESYLQALIPGVAAGYDAGRSVAESRECFVS
jgi:hypothetical protein